MTTTYETATNEQTVRSGIERALNELSAYGTPADIRVALEQGGFLRGTNSGSNCPVYHYLCEQVPTADAHIMTVGSVEVLLIDSSGDVPIPEPVRDFIGGWDEEYRKTHVLRLPANSPLASVPGEFSSPFGDLG